MNDWKPMDDEAARAWADAIGEARDRERIVRARALLLATRRDAIGEEERDVVRDVLRMERGIAGLVPTQSVYRMLAVPPRAERWVLAACLLLGVGAAVAVGAAQRMDDVEGAMARGGNGEARPTIELAAGTSRWVLPSDSGVVPRVRVPEHGLWLRPSDPAARVTASRWSPDAHAVATIQVELAMPWRPLPGRWQLTLRMPERRGVVVALVEVLP